MEKRGQDFIAHMTNEFDRIGAKYDSNVVDQVFGSLRVKPDCDVCKQWRGVYKQCPKCNKIFVK